MARFRKFPKNIAGNSVAALKTEGFVATQPTKDGLRGVVLKWTPEVGWNEVPNTIFNYKNGFTNIT
jgi:hypothetical protein